MKNQLLLALKNNKLLKNVDISKINLQNIKGKLVTINEGEILYRESDSASSIFLVASGEINLVRKKLLGKTRSLILNENEFLGNDEFFDETARTSTAVALKDSYLIELSDTEVHDLIQQDSVVYENLREPLYSDIDDVPVDEYVPPAPAPDHDEEPVVEETIAADPVPKINTIVTQEVSPEAAVTSDDPLAGFQDQIKTETNIADEPKIDESIKPEDTLISSSSTEGIFPGQDKTEDDIFNALDSIDHHQKNDEAPKDDFDSVTFNALENIDEPSNDIPLDPNNDLKEDDASFFAGLSTAEDTMPEIKEPEKPIQDIPDIEDTAPANNFIEEPLPGKIETPINITDDVPEIVEKEQPQPKVEVPPVTDIETAVKPKQLEDEVMTSEQLEMINKAAELVNSNIQIDDVLNTIVDVASNLTSADRGTLYLVDKENDELWSKVAMGNEMKEIRVKIGEGISGWAAQSGEIVNIEDVKSDQRFKADFDKSSGYETKNMLCYPIKNKKHEVVGVLQLINSERGKFTDLDHEFLNALSIHAALALENASLVEKLLHGERVSSLGKMANFLIQDIKKPILVSKRYAEHLKTKELPSEITQVLDMMLEQLNQVADLVQTTSSYSEGKRILHTLTVNFMETMDDFSQRMASYVQTRNCEIVNNVDANVSLKLDVKEFYQCYMHIVRNACDAMPDGGRVVVYSSLEDKKLTLSFKDDGLGIPDSIKDKVFEPFTSHGKKEGTGLGLSITKQIVEAHGGEISVESALGEGATINITLPV